MRLIINEVKKLLNIKSIITLGILFYIIWSIFIRFHIEYFPNGNPQTQEFEASEIMLREYGETIDENEMMDFKEKTELLYKEADQYILAEEYCISLGLETYKEFKNLWSETWGEDEKLEEIHSRLFFEQEETDVFWDLEAREDLISRYEDKEDWTNGFIDTSDERALNRAKEILNDEGINSPLNYIIFENYNDLISNFSIIIVISVAFVISYLFIKDSRNKVNYLQYSSKVGRDLVNKKIVAGFIAIIIVISVAFVISYLFIKDSRNKVNYLQYSSKVGRDLVNKKIVAGFIVSFIVVTIEIILFFLIYSKNNSLQFWNCSINSVFVNEKLWLDFTFGQYILLSVMLMYIVTFIVATLSMFVSSKVSSYISFIGLQIPILGLLISFLMTIGMKDLTVMWFSKYILHITYGALVLILIVLIVCLINKEKIRDIKI